MYVNSLLGTSESTERLTTDEKAGQFFAVRGGKNFSTKDKKKEFPRII